MKGKYKGPKYPTEADGKIPSFNNYEEEANFWDTHSVTDFEDETEDVDIVFELDKPRDKTVVLRLQEDIKNRLEKKARLNGLNVSTLIRMLIMKDLQTPKYSFS
jgi:predicted DNA binding CopG/RHH family protein